MEEQFIVKSSHDLKTELQARYKAARFRIDDAARKQNEIKLRQEKERLAELKEKEKHRKELLRRKAEDELIRKFKIQRDYLILQPAFNGETEMPPRKLEDEIEFWKEASKYIRGQSIPDSIRRIVAEVCVKHKKHLIDIESERRDVEIVPARQELMYRLRTETTWSLPRIGRFIGNRDHTTVIHGYQKFKKQLEKGEVSI